MTIPQAIIAAAIVISLSVFGSALLAPYQASNPNQKLAGKGASVSLAIACAQIVADREVNTTRPTWAHWREAPCRDAPLASLDSIYTMAASSSHPR